MKLKKFVISKQIKFCIVKRVTAIYVYIRSRNAKEEGWKPTLVEVSWPEINLSSNVAHAVISPKLFPKEGSSKQDYGAFVSVTGLDVDARGRLWILDAPDRHDRWPRIVIYDLKRNDRLVSIKLYNISKLEIHQLIHKIKISNY